MLNPGMLLHTTCTFVLVLTLTLASAVSVQADEPVNKKPESDAPYVVVLGIAQDAGYPQAACNKSCCEPAWNDASLRRHPSCLAVVDPKTRQRWLFDCTPAFAAQLRLLDDISKSTSGTLPVDAKGRSQISGIFLTHGHIGHYTGLMHLGREVMGSGSVPVFAMPRMRKFLSSNGPWSQLVSLKNIALKNLADRDKIQLNERISVTPFLVPHRDEFTETVGFRIAGPGKQVLFIPDIDKWEKWDRRIEAEITEVDIAFLDGTFFGEGELPGRNMSEIPHPFIQESVDRFCVLPAAHRSKVHFIHLNHSNPALDSGSSAATKISDVGMNVAVQGQVIRL